MSFKERIQAIKNNVAAREDGKWEHVTESVAPPAAISAEVSALAESMEILAVNGNLQHFIEASMNDAADKKETGRVLGEALALLEKKAKLGSGARFKAVEKAAEKSGASDPAAVAAAAGRKKYGKKKMAKMAAAGRK